MSDVTVDGIEPTLLVKYVGNSNHNDSTTRIDLFPTDDGAPRHLSLNGDPVKITTNELALIGGNFQIEEVNEDVGNKNELGQERTVESQQIPQSAKPLEEKHLPTSSSSQNPPAQG